tara:strand:- start:1083 stop:1979 length:897 start_codon:yes stop_codon:yes gene_type:complete
MKYRFGFRQFCLAIICSLTALSAQAVEILFAHVSNSYAPYHDDGDEIAGYVNALAGYNVTIRDLNTAVYNDYGNFDQVWVYDLYTGADNNASQLANYQNISSWYNGLGMSQQNLIVDGRIISSATGLPWHAEPDWIQNYALELMDNGRTGGLFLGTDHSPYQSGINQINAGINISPFVGNVNSTYSVVDTNSPLYTAAGTFDCPGNPGKRCIWDNSSPGYAPAGLQANGQTLTPVAYHGTTNDAFDNASVSSTLGSSTFGTCGNAGQPPCETPVPSPLLLIGAGLLGLAWSQRGTIRR